MSEAQQRLLAVCRERGLRVYALADESIYPGAVILHHGLCSRELEPLEREGFLLAPAGRHHVFVEAPR